MIKLEYFTCEDFENLLNWIQNEELLLHWAGTQFRFPLTKRKLEWYIKDTNEFHISSTLVYKAVDLTQGKTVGHISLTSINRTNRSARITRVFVSETERGKGVAEQMVRELMKIGFDQLNLHRISLGVYDDNPAAITCYKKCGFQVDGILRDIQKYGDNYWSLMEMSILEGEWQSFKKLNNEELNVKVGVANNKIPAELGSFIADN